LRTDLLPRLLSYLIKIGLMDAPSLPSEWYNSLTSLMKTSN